MSVGSRMFEGAPIENWIPGWSQHKSAAVRPNNGPVLKVEREAFGYGKRGEEEKDGEKGEADCPSLTARLFPYACFLTILFSFNLKSSNAKERLIFTGAVISSVIQTKVVEKKIPTHPDNCGNLPTNSLL